MAAFVFSTTSDLSYCIIILASERVKKKKTWIWIIRESIMSKETETLGSIKFMHFIR